MQNPGNYLGLCPQGRGSSESFFFWMRKMYFLPLALIPQAFAGFYYTFHFLNLTSQQSLNDVNSTIQTFCRKNWAEVRAL